MRYRIIKTDNIDQYDAQIFVGIGPIGVWWSLDEDYNQSTIEDAREKISWDKNYRNRKRSKVVEFL